MLLDLAHSYLKITSASFAPKNVTQVINTEFDVNSTTKSRSDHELTLNVNKCSVVFFFGNKLKTVLKINPQQLKFYTID